VSSLALFGRRSRYRYVGEDRFFALFPADVDWQPFAAFPPEVRLAVLVGDPTKPGLYVVRIRLPEGARVMPHTFPEDCICTVLEGTFCVGAGAAFDRDCMTALAPGSVAVLPGGQPHFHSARSGDCVVQVTAAGPLGLRYVVLADDPREATPALGLRGPWGDDIQ
jgi:quercetin dioxygenase-like cupin family protein